MNERDKYFEATELLQDLSEITRILMRLFITENKFHISLIFEKMFKMFVSFFDVMYEIQERKIEEIKNEFSHKYNLERQKSEKFIRTLEVEIGLLRKFKQHET
mmetsp:Transcript_1030/g.1019  ORF Transcript_1030/g.1019 Transcript_1030/m.1019 type:complete len:103 (+) Transcript_1030:159-467(+)